MKTYRGHIIHPCAPNPAGMRWYCLTSQGRFMADTLEGIKRMIRGLRRASYRD